VIVGGLSKCEGANPSDQGGEIETKKCDKTNIERKDAERRAEDIFAEDLI
jgi:hypothetical protein